MIHYDTIPVGATALYSGETEPFVREMERRGVFREKQPAYPGMGSLAAKWFDHTGCDVWFLSRVWPLPDFGTLR